MIPAWRYTPSALPRTAQRPQRSAVAGFSLAEMIVVIAVLGSLAAIAVMNLSGVTEASREIAAREKLEILNRAVHTFSQARSPLTETPMSSQTDEFLIIGYLHFRAPEDENPSPGSPYLDRHYQPPSSSSTEDYRIVWTSNFVFKLLKPGEVGTGIKVPFDGSDYKTALAPGVDPKNRGF